MGLKGKLRRLERRAEEDMIAIPQPDGPPAKFPRCALKEAFSNAMERLGAGEDAPPRHPLLEAAANSTDPRWAESFFGDIDCPDAPTPVEDLSEP
jgi:hypothetical protein